MADDGIQRRRFPRYPTSLEATVYLASGAVTAHIAQISRGGCLIFPPLAPQSSPAIKLSFQLAKDLPSINCKAEIVYSIVDRGTGVSFTEISQFNQELIAEFFQKQPAAEKASGA
jgi:PilZ domain